MRYVDMFRFWASNEPDREFAVDERRSVTYGEADVRARQIVASLQAGGLGVGDHVSILANNSIDFAIYYLGCALAGCVPTPLNYRLVGPELAYILNNCEATLLLADAAFVPAVDAIRAEVPLVQTFVVIDGDAPAGWVSFASWYDVDPIDPNELPVVPGSTTVLQIYTSGTTGRPKGVMMTHDAIASYVMVQAAPLFPLDVLQGRLLVVAPMFHAGISMLWYMAVAWGGSLYIQERFVARDTVDALRDADIAWTLLIPAMVQACLVDIPDVANRPYDRLKLITYGGSSIAETTLRNAIDVFGCEFVQLYGLTETNAITNMLPDDHRVALESRPELLRAAGRPLPGCAVRVVGADGGDASVGEIGEILLRGPQVMAGYWNDDTATAEALREGWLWTGDAGSLDDDGYLYVRDRIKDMIVSGGENVYSREVEDVIFKHPGVVDAAVIGIPDERWGETVLALVVLEEGGVLDPAELIAFCRRSLAGFKCPKAVEQVDELPRNPSGKVLKRELRERYIVPSN